MKFLRALSFLFLFIALVVSVAFAFIEIRSMVAHDYTLMQNPTFSLIGYIGRAIFFILLFYCIISLFIRKMFKKRTSISLFVLSLALIAGAITSFFFYMFAIAIALVVISVLIFIISLARLLSV